MELVILSDILGEVQHDYAEIEDVPENTKTDIAVGLSEPECSSQVLLCGEDRIRTCVGFPLPAFQAGALGHSATSP